MDTRRGRRPLSQLEIERAIAEDLELLEECTEAYADAPKVEAMTSAAYKREFARALLRSNGPRHQQEAAATESSGEALEEFLNAEAESKALKERLWTIRNSLDALRSLNANVREQV